MTKANFRDYIKNMLAKVDKTNKYHPVVIDHAIEKALNGIFAEMALKAPQELDQYTKEYNLSLSQDGTSNNYTATLTAPYVNIPDKRNGIRFIEAQGNYSEITFVPYTQKEFYIYPNTYSASISDRIPYYVDRTTVYFYAPTTAVISSGVTVHQVLPFSSYANTDVVNIPMGQDKVIADAVLEHLRGIPPVDLANDNNDTQE